MLRLYHLSDTLGARIEDPCNVPSDLDADQERTLKSPCLPEMSQVKVAHSSDPAFTTRSYH